MQHWINGSHAFSESTIRIYVFRCCIDVMQLELQEIVKFFTTKDMQTPSSSAPPPPQCYSHFNGRCTMCCIEYKFNIYFILIKFEVAQLIKLPVYSISNLLNLQLNYNQVNMKFLSS